MDYSNKNAEDGVLKIVILANAFLLVIGTFVQVVDSPVKHLILTLCFLAWMGLFAWRLVHATAPASR